MKTLFITLITTIGIYITAYSQREFTLLIEDNTGRKDTVFFGSEENSTIGIDSVLGEKDIYSQPYDSLEIRSIQRDSTNHHCLKYPWSEQEIYSNDNFDTKIDYRPFEVGLSPAFDSILFNYEFIINAYAYPVKVSGNFNDLGYFSTVASFNLLDSNCNIMETVYAGSYYMEDIFTINSPEVNTITFHLEHFVGINENSDSNTWHIFPNPSYDHIEINNLNNSIDVVSIIDPKGSVWLTKRISINDNSIQLDINHLPEGIYVVQLRDIDSGHHSTDIFQKVSQ